MNFAGSLTEQKWLVPSEYPYRAVLSTYVGNFWRNQNFFENFFFVACQDTVERAFDGPDDFLFRVQCLEMHFGPRKRELQ